jgi:hypothetical protein
MYFEKLLESLRNDNTEDLLMSKIINPFSLYYLCDHYYGDEIAKRNIPILLNKKYLNVKNLKSLKDYDIIFCEVNFFKSFCRIIDKIEKKIILLTGQWHLPYIQKSKQTEKIKNHNNVILWISQNPIYENDLKYIAFPYGIHHENLKIYADYLLKNVNIKKNQEVIYLPINRETNNCRKMLPPLPPISLSQYYEKMAESKYVISPIGDRDDCYRHYEAIGLGTTPISNVSPLYRNIFGESMLYATTEDLIFFSRDATLQNETYPNKDLICYDYFKDLVLSRIAEFKTKN